MATKEPLFCEYCGDEIEGKPIEGNDGYYCCDSCKEDAEEEGD